MIRLDTSEIPGDSDVPDIAIEDGITTRYVAGRILRSKSWHVSSVMVELIAVMMNYGIFEDNGL